MATNHPAPVERSAKILIFPTHLHAIAEAARAAGLWEPAILAVLSAPVRVEDEAKAPEWWLKQIAAKEEELLVEAVRRRAARRAAGGANDAAEPLTPADIANVMSLVAYARGALDDLWYAATDAASKKPEASRSFWRREVHRRGYEVLRGLRAVEGELEEFQKRVL